MTKRSLIPYSSLKALPSAEFNSMADICKRYPYIVDKLAEEANVHIETEYPKSIVIVKSNNQYRILEERDEYKKDSILLLYPMDSECDYFYYIYGANNTSRNFMTPISYQEDHRGTSQDCYNIRTGLRLLSLIATPTVSYLTSINFATGAWPENDQNYLIPLFLTYIKTLNKNLSA